MKKIDTAIGIVRNTPDKSLALSEIMNILGVSRSNAFVYFTKATKALSSYDTVDKVMTGKVSKVTESSVARRTKKTADIDAVIASLKGTTASPFAGLGA
jgi:hypothetical protein